MDKLSLICQCGQEMLVPGTAIGRTGLCPGCGTQIAITAENTHPYQPRHRQNGSKGGGLLALRRRAEVRQEIQNREEAWRNFAAAVDLYNARRYAEALTLLNTLLQQFPGNDHVETARDQCLQALQRTTQSAHFYDGLPVDDGVLSPELVKSVVLDKLLNGATEEVQLKAAELAARLLGLAESTSVSSAPPEEEELPDVALQVSPPPPTPDPVLHPGSGPCNAAPGAETLILRGGNGRRFLRPIDKEDEAAPPASRASTPASPGVELVLPDSWRFETRRSPRFAEKITFE